MHHGVREVPRCIRIARTNVDGAKKITYALMSTKGLGIRLANAIVGKAGLDRDTRLGVLSEGRVERIESIVENPVRHDIAGWLFNRQRDRETGSDFHLIGSDIDLQVKSDVDFMKRTRSWKGYQHSYELKVRGQKTRTTGRTGKAVSVRRKT